MAQVFIRDIVKLNNVPKNIVSDRDVKFTSKFWKEFFAGWGIDLAFNTAYHQKIDGQTERINKILVRPLYY